MIIPSRLAEIRARLQALRSARTIRETCRASIDMSRHARDDIAWLLRLCEHLLEERTAMSMLLRPDEQESLVASVERLQCRVVAAERIRGWQDREVN